MPLDPDTVREYLMRAPEGEVVQVLGLLVEKRPDLAPMLLTLLNTQDTPDAAQAR